ncbi:signal peptidase I [Acinetobacter sp. KAM398]|uniref:Signal peptidase I n=1 Tax=Acinetobacter towneri TaxID=202956 RepID=A0A1E8E2L4_9GAMM|nr:MULTISPECIES: signal peptidase I [Acinetobacter]MDM1754084.1 signal peptidase I [Acinetobacter towneri]OFE43744.1 signal peptidase I [Acinetobacter towneri]GJC30156.1 signal peptidase I [Acinetobacter sp. KAM392]GJC32966.1 signal peptidase I [Acinetobacter sp. KAM393]GJC35795.1 signal peptidase I [Acinetobacter sp. KAM394]
MDFDFNLILVPATLFFIVVWLLDKFVFKQRATKGRGNENFIITWAYDFWPVLAVVMVLRSFLYEPFNIPSDSMVPTLETGDFILVNKFEYGVRLPIINSKIIDVGSPERGEVAVFRYPPQPSISYIKRIVGLPGDHIVYDHGQLSINGKKVTKTPIQFSREKDSLDTPTSIYHQETLGTHTFTMRELEGVNVARQAPFLNYVDNGKYSAENGLYWEVKVPDGHYFAMGDNRDQSADSRFWGFVPEENLTGRAFYIWMHKEPGFNLPSFSRNGKID